MCNRVESMTVICPGVNYCDLDPIDCSAANDCTADAMIGTGCDAGEWCSPDFYVDGEGQCVEPAGSGGEGDSCDLGCGAGLDAFVARNEVGATGRVIGVDMTAEMIAKARDNAAKLDLDNVEFRLGEIEHLPVRSGTIDVVISNCVLNLVPDKQRAFAEVHRVLRPGGHFCISDIVASRELPEWVKGIAEAYAGCVSGAIPKSDYLEIIAATGFGQVTVRADSEQVG